MPTVEVASFEASPEEEIPWSDVELMAPAKLEQFLAFEEPKTPRRQWDLSEYDHEELTTDDFSSDGYVFCGGGRRNKNRRRHEH